MNEEQYLIERVGKGNPFRVPEGYFEDLSKQVIQALPENQGRMVHLNRTRRLWLRPSLRWAAVFVGLLVMSVLSWRAFSNADPDTPSVQQMAVAQPDEEAFDEAADYAMLDNQDIYTYLADN